MTCGASRTCSVAPALRTYDDCHILVTSPLLDMDGFSFAVLGLGGETEFEADRDVDAPTRACAMGEYTHCRAVVFLFFFSSFFLPVFLVESR